MSIPPDFPKVPRAEEFPWPHIDPYARINPVPAETPPSEES